MTEDLKIVPLPSWWQKSELNDLSISELFEDLLSWNSESKLITPKYITCTYFGAIVATFDFIFSVCFLCVIFFNPWAGLKSQSCHLLARSPRRSTGDKSGLCNWNLCLSVCLFSGLLKFSNLFILQEQPPKPAPATCLSLKLARSPTIHRPQWIRWPQLLNSDFICLIDCVLVCKQILSFISSSSSVSSGIKF